MEGLPLLLPSPSRMCPAQLRASELPRRTGSLATRHYRHRYASS